VFESQSADKYFRLAIGIRKIFSMASAKSAVEITSPVVAGEPAAGPTEAPVRENRCATPERKEYRASVPAEEFIVPLLQQRSSRNSIVFRPAIRCSKCWTLAAAVNRFATP
jgi:hypothetical protein